MFEICLKLSEPVYLYADQIVIVTSSKIDQLQTPSEKDWGFGEVVQNWAKREKKPSYSIRKTIKCAIKKNVGLKDGDIEG